MWIFINKSKKRKLFIFFVITIAVLLISGCATEEDAWEAANEADTIESYEEYLEKYPEGEYVEEAEELIEELVWQMAMREDTIESYEEYLENYPEGEYVKEAKKLIEELEEKDVDYSIYIKLVVDEDGEPTRLNVIEGEYQLKNGATAWAGSSIYYDEENMTFPKGLLIEIIGGEVELKDAIYPDGTRLLVDSKGSLNIIE